MASPRSIHEAPESQIDCAPSRAYPRQLRSGNYRVNFRDGNETTAYYTDKLEDAVDAVVVMARKRAFSSNCRADSAPLN